MTGGSLQRGCACGHALRRSRARTMSEKFVRHVLRLRKYRCDACKRTTWLSNSQAVWRQMKRVRRDSVARRVVTHRWRRAVLIAVVAIVSAVVLGQAVGRWHEAMSMSEPVP